MGKLDDYVLMVGRIEEGVMVTLPELYINAILGGSPYLLYERFQKITALP